ncbi:hypothetical protein BKA62DRAFT_70435 [Auriculariales sp. MPI-PUGE-AT-0066]|nr:hypothetical protein BKA62DRAFT_70435 [Auriculariales sp. MPI-PUGE-AT-0066]
MTAAKILQLILSEVLEYLRPDVLHILDNPYSWYSFTYEPLPTCSLVSRAWRETAQIAIFQQVVILRATKPAPLVTLKNQLVAVRLTCFLKSIQTAPHLAAIVKTLDADCNDVVLSNRLPEILHLCDNLSTLNFHFLNNGTGPIMPHITALSQPLSNILSYGCYDSRSFDFHLIMKMFPKLTMLHATDLMDLHPIPTSVEVGNLSIRELQLRTCTKDWLAFFARACRIETLLILEPYVATLTAIACMKDTLTDLRISFTSEKASYHQGPRFDEVLSELRHLRSLVAIELRQWPTCWPKTLNRSRSI